LAPYTTKVLKRWERGNEKREVSGPRRWVVYSEELKKKDLRVVGGEESSQPQKRKCDRGAILD